MAWTRTKTMATTGATLLVMIALAVVMKLVFFPSVSDKYFVINPAQLQHVPPGLVVVRPTHFPKMPTNQITGATVKESQWLVGRNVTFQNLIAMAYGSNPGRVALPVGAPKNNFDFLVTVPKDPEPHLQSAIRRKLGYVAGKEMRDTPVLALKVENPNSDGLKISPDSEREKEDLRNGRLYFTHMKLNVIMDGLESVLKTPVVDKTGLTNYYDFSLIWDTQTAKQIQSGTLDQTTGQKILTEWGLGLEPDMASLEMLVVKRVN
jgi:uncharacterized protein (TIGR03435 family)